MSRLEEQRLKRAEGRKKQSRSLKVAGSIAVLLLAGTLIVRFGLHGRDGSTASPATPSNPTSTSSTISPSQAASTAPSPATSAAGSAAGTPSASATPASASGQPEGDAARVKLSFVGDILLGSTVENVLKQNGYDHPYKDVKSFIQSADIAVANLETPITERGQEQSKEYVYRSSPKTLPAFAEAGFDLVNLANNHTIDYGTEGLLDTLDNLDKAGIRRVGAGRDADEAFKPVIVESKGIKIAFLGFSKVVPDNSWKAGVKHPGVADTYNYKPPVAAIEKAREQADLVVVLAHWGDERTDKPNKDQLSLAKRYIDAGADLVVGSHPHVLQGFESYKGKWIAYSLGNFIFTTNNVRDTLDTVILEASCSKDRQCELQMKPIYTIWAKPEPMSAENGAKLIERLNGISFHTRIDASGRLFAQP